MILLGMIFNNPEFVTPRLFTFIDGFTPTTDESLVSAFLFMTSRQHSILGDRFPKVLQIYSAYLQTPFIDHTLLALKYISKNGSSYLVTHSDFVNILFEFVSPSLGSDNLMRLLYILAQIVISDTSDNKEALCQRLPANCFFLMIQMLFF